MVVRPSLSFVGAHYGSIVLNTTVNNESVKD
jgi:hypothetical protein